MMSGRDLTGLRGRDRGQTTQDFATGISVFLLTVTFTFAFVPATVTPFGSPVTDAIPAKSDRVASTIIDTNAVDGSSRTLDNESIDGLIGEGGSDLRAEFGLRSTAQVNITIQRRNGDIVKADLTGSDPGYRLVAGDDYPQNQAAASTTRVVRMDVDGCRTGCLLVVRVW
ncbi:hypothetical protein G9C85_00755 [Halorubellus sp. JP-L1]|uniref:DUF7287 family protein n=1 Tax=Halorubellus sp. JP-L1 TaxID=2715753 RepID=UPI00140E59F1|nr:hypothetical protein [Halorubellus sp. JP-L1]NHN40165.1 hypothetical protein [Halorubellus sp. JP-L1]